MTERKPLRIGMIGCGEIAYTATGPAICETSNAEMVLAMDPVPDIAESFGRRFDIPWTTTLNEVLERPDIEAVLISTPHDTHCSLTEAAARAGKHVMVEKPIACTLVEADRMIAACREAGVWLSVNFVLRYDSGPLDVRRLVASGAIGEVIAVSFRSVGRKPDHYWTGGYTNRVQTDWRKYRKRAGGGVLIMNFIHNLDLLRFMTGLEVSRVYAEYGTFLTPVEVEDIITMTLRFHNGAVGALVGATCMDGHVRLAPVSLGGSRTEILHETVEDNSDRIYGTRGQIRMQGRHVWVYTRESVEGLKRDDWTRLDLTPTNARANYVEAFARTVRQGRPPEISGEEGRKALEIVEAAYRSCVEGRPLTLPLSLP